MSVFVSGSFDLLHSGHIAFFKQVSLQFGEPIVGIGSDASIFELKHRPTVFNQDERLFMVRAVRYVSHVWINSGMGNMDFIEDVLKYNRNVFYDEIDTLVVNEDQDFEEKRKWCLENGIMYKVLKRIPEKGLPERSTTQIRTFINNL